MVANLALLILEVLLLGGTVLVLHRLSSRYGLTPLIAFTIGLTVFVQAANTTLVYIQLSPDFYVVIASAIYVPIILLAVLVLYVVEGTVPARLTIFSILGVSMLYFLLLLSGKLHLSLAGGGSFMGLTPDSPFISPDLTSALASLIAFAADLFIIAIVYQGIKNYAPRLPAWIGPGLALMISLWSDTILYQVLIYGVSPDFFVLIADDLLGKTMVGLVLWPLAALYLIRVAPGLPSFRGVESRPTFDLLFGPFRGMEAALARSEAALRESEDKFRSIFEQSSDSIVLCNEEGRIIAWNQAAEQMTGLKSAEALGQYYWDIQFRLLPEAQATPAAYERARSMMREALHTGQATWLNHLLEGEIRDPAGGRRYFQQVASPILTTKGFMISSIARDITERKRAEEASRESEQRFRLFMQHFPGLAYIKDAATRVLFANQGFMDYLNIAPAAILGKTNQDTFPAEFAEQITADDQRVLESGASEVIEEHYAGRIWSTYKFVISQTDKPALLGGFTLDITERKKTEEALQMFQYTIDQASDAVQWLNREGGFEYVNDQACRSLGYTHEELMRLRLWDVDPIYPRERWDKNWESYQDGRRGGSENLETLHRRKDGSVFPVEVSSNHLWFGDRELHVAVVRDITERKRAEEALRRTQFVVDRAKDAIHWVDADGRLVYANDSICKSLGYTREELLAMTIFDIDPIFPKETWPDHWQKMSKLGSYSFETVHKAKDGHIFPVEVSIDVMRFDGKEFHSIYARDITERRQTEQLLQLRLRLMEFAATHSLAELLQKTLDEVGELTNSPIGFYHFVEADQQTLSLQAWSTRTLNEFCEAEGQGLHYPIDQAGVWTDCVRERRPVIHNDYPALPHRRGLPEGHAQVRSELVVPILRSDRIVAILGVGNKAQAYTEKDVEVVSYVADVAWEIAERKRAEDEREKLIADLEAKNAELERFTYTVSHDLKAPLITIRGFLGFLEKDVRAGDVERMQADMKRIVEASDKMQRLLSELLELSRIGRMMNPPEAVPFETIVHEAIDLVRGRLEARGVHMEVAPDLPIVYGDHVRLVEVVQNLVDNSAKFMGSQAEPQITIEQQRTDRDGKPIFFVRDNGIGIDPVYQDKVFGLFNKLDPQSEGTGVGLALVKRIVEVHGGRVWVESEGEGRGTTIFFTLATPPTKG